MDEAPTIGTIETKTGYIVFKIPENYITDASANAYNVVLTIRITPENQNTRIIEKTVTFNLIPTQIYMKLSPQVGLV